jgi:hypothetical protein
VIPPFNAVLRAILRLIPDQPAGPYHSLFLDMRRHGKPDVHLIAQHQDPEWAITWSRRNERIAIGRGLIDEIRQQGYRSAKEMGAAIRKEVIRGEEFPPRWTECIRLHEFGTWISSTSGVRLEHVPLQARIFAGPSSGVPTRSAKQNRGARYPHPDDPVSRVLAIAYESIHRSAERARAQCDKISRPDHHRTG